MLLDILKRKHFCDVFLLIKDESKSFNEIQKKLNMYPDTLNRRIKELIGYDLIESVVIHVEGRDRIKYQLTKKGKDMLPEIEEFVRLSKKIEDEIKS